MGKQPTSLQDSTEVRGHFSETMSGATALHEKAVAMNEALVLGSIRQHELTEAAENLNARLLAEITERTHVEEALRASDERLLLAHAELADHAAKLESLVAERTAALSATNRQLESSIASIEQGKEEFRSLFLESEAMQEKLRGLTRHFLTVQENDRREISRELHDQVVQVLVGICVELAGLQNSPAREGAEWKERIAEGRSRVEDSIAVIHRFARDLRPAVLDDLGLNPALQSYLKDFIERTGIRVDFSTYEKVEMMKLSVRTVFFRIAQEALANVDRHSGVSRAALTLVETSGNVTMEIKDEGVGFDANLPGNKRLGLLGMKERIEMVGGTFRVESSPGGPTSVRVRIPSKRARGVDEASGKFQMTHMKRITVLLAEDHTIVREGLRALLKAESDIEVVGEAGNGRQAVAIARKLRPDVVVMDIAMPLLNGMEAARRIREMVPTVKVLVLSAHSDEAYVQRALEVGAAGYLLKQTAAHVLPDAIGAVCRDEQFFSPVISQRQDQLKREAKARGSASDSAPALTSRETEILQLVAEGKANKETAAELGISIKTVEKHRQHVMEKLGIHDTATLTRYAIAAGIIESSVQVTVL